MDASGQGISLPDIQRDVSDDVLYLWKAPRAEVEGIYAEAFKRDDLDTLRWLAAYDRYFLLTCIIRRPDARHDWIYARCREVEAAPYSKLDLWARVHYKSSIITFAGVIQEIILDPEITIGIFSHDRPNAKAFLRVIKLEMEENPLLHQIFPEIFWKTPKKESPRWSEDEGIVVRRAGNPREGTIEAWGIESLPVGKHFKLRLYDDIITEDSATNPDMIKKITTQWELSINLGVPGGKVQTVGTRYHFADTYGVMISRGVQERRYPATHDGTFDGKPVFLTQEQWEELCALTTKPIIASQQLLNPLAGSETTFDITQLKFWNIRPKRVNIYIMMDASKGQTETSDYTAISIIAIDIHKNKYLIDGWRHRMRLSKRWQLLRDAYRRWIKMPGVSSVNVGVEQFSLQTDVEYFEERMEIEKFSFPIEELNWPRQGQKSKIHRIERLEPDVRMGRFRIPHVINVDDEGQITLYDPRKRKDVIEVIEQRESWRVATPILKIDEDGKRYNLIDKFVEEFIFFPFAPNDDFLDATSRIYDMDPTVPIFYNDEPGSEFSTEPELFEDGI